MNMIETNKKNNDKLADSKTFTLMNDFNELVVLNPAVQVIDDKTKPKRANVIKAVSVFMQPYHDNFKNPVKDFGDSVILIGNEIAAKYMVEETILFIEYLKEFNLATQNITGVQNVKSISAVQELSPYYKNNFKLTPKKLTDALFYDLERYAEQYQFSADDIKAYAVSLLKKNK